MGLFEECKKLLNSVIPMFKEDGFTNDDIIDGFKYAKKILKKFRMIPIDKRKTLSDVLDSMNDELKNGK